MSQRNNGYDKRYRGYSPNSVRMLQAARKRAESERTAREEEEKRRSIERNEKLYGDKAKQFVDFYHVNDDERKILFRTPHDRTRRGRTRRNRPQITTKDLFFLIPLLRRELVILKLINRDESIYSITSLRELEKGLRVLHDKIVERGGPSRLTEDLRNAFGGFNFVIPTDFRPMRQLIENLLEIIETRKRIVAQLLNPYLHPDTARITGTYMQFGSRKRDDDACVIL